MATASERPLLTLPGELLLEVCSHLCWSSTGARPLSVDVSCIAAIKAEAAVCQTALDALGRTCTLLRGVAHGLLYRGPCITRADGMGRLLQTLATRPDLAAAVSELHDLRTTIDDAALLAETQPEHVAFHDPATASLAVVALSLMPNLVRAHLRLPAEACFAPDWLVARPDRAQADAPSLRALTLSSPGPEFQLALDSRGLFQHRYLANLEHLHVHGGKRCIPRSPVESSPTARPRQPLLQKLASLALTRMNLSATSVRHLLALVGNVHGAGGLTAVHIDFERPPTLLQEYDRHADGSSVWAVQLDEVLDLCYPWRNTLTSLSFHREDKKCEPIFDLDLTKMREYTVLRSLSTEACLLRMFNSDHPGCLTRLLPPSIQNLRLFGEGYPALSLQTLLESHQGGLFPHLRVVGLDALDADPGLIDDGEFGSLARLYRSAGLVLCFEDTSL